MTPPDQATPDQATPDQATPRPALKMSWWRALWSRDLLQPSAMLVLWVYLYLLVLLAGWVLLAAAATGWTPVVITSDSMRPTMRAGDVVLIDEHPESLLAQQAVVTFAQPDGSLVTHRVFAVEGDEYVTKGDANPTPDAQRIAPSDVRGVGRLVVPLIGMPVVWAQTANTFALSSWAVLSLGAFAVALAAARRWLHQRAPRAQRLARRRDHEVPIAQRGIRRVRVLIAILIASQFVIDPSRLDMGIGFGRGLLLAISVAALATVNGGSVLAERRGSDAAARFAVVELVADTCLVIFLTTATGTGGVGWVLFALPIVEAATRFRLAGALVHWMGLTAITLASQIWAIDHSEPGSRILLGDLERVLDQLSVLLLVIIPGAYLAEQLIGDVLAQRRATGEALERSQLLHLVAQAGHEVSRLDIELSSTLTRTALQLGFDGADLCAKHGEGWRILAVSGTLALPAPGTPGSGLRAVDREVEAVVVDHRDDDSDEVISLQTHGIEELIRCHLGDTGMLLALRVATAEGTAVRGAQVDALQLLCRQADVAVRNGRLVSELHDLHDELERQANQDALTGLANRTQFRQSLRKALHTCADWSAPPAVLFIDLNGFKGVNDRLGHEAGDELLRAIAGRLGARITEPDLVARLGGDEFTVLVAASSPTALTGLVTDLLSSFETPFRIAGNALRVSAAIGAATAAHGTDDGELLRRADVAMYAAKSGRVPERFAHYEASLDADDRRRLKLSADLEKAIGNGELELLYQPIVENRAGYPIVGVEALLRWRHSEHGAISPPEIVALAEDAGHATELNRWILHRATADAAAWHSGVFLTVNASPTELALAGLEANVADALLYSGLAPGALYIEISERVVSTGDAAATANMAVLARAGVRFLLDDFGQGRTSLAHLRGLPISGIKLDRSLVVNAASAETDQIILDSVSKLARELGFFAVAEGVETEAQHQAVSHAGGELLQGYRFFRPMSADAVGQLLADHSVAGLGTR